MTGTGTAPRVSSSPSARRGQRVALIGVGVILTIAIGGAAWFLVGDAPDEVDISAATAEIAEDGATGPAEPTAETAADTGGAPEGVDGTWVVDTSVGGFSVTESTGTFVGVRIAEVLANIGETTAVARTPDVSGTVTLEGATLTAADITANLTTLVSDESRREPHIQRALDTATYPTATFKLTEPVDLGTLPTADSPVEVTATGELTIAGVTNTVEVPLQAAMVDDIAVVTGSFDIAFGDYGVQVPSAPVVVSVDDAGTVELQLYLTRG